MKRWWLRLAPYARVSPGRALALTALVLLGVALEALLPWPLKLIVDHVLAERPLPEAVAWLAGMPGATSAAGLLGWLALSVLLAFLAGQAVHLAKSLLQADLSARMQYRLAGDLFERLQSLSLVYHARSRKGDLAHRVAMDSACVPTLVMGVALSLATALLTLVVLIGILWQLHAALAAIALAVALPMGLLMRRLAPRMAERAYEQQRLQGEIWSIAEQTLSSLPIVQAFAREELEGVRFRHVSTRTIQSAMRLLAAQLQFKVGVEGCVAAGTAAVMLIGGWQVLSGRASLGTLVVFFSYLTALYAPLVGLAYLSSTFADAAGGARRAMEVLDAREHVEEASTARALPTPARGQVRFERIVFGYEPGRPVLNAISLEVAPGETVALVGPTGAGKSTLVALIPRLFDPWEGRVLVDGADVREATLASVRARVALVLQDPFLLPLSIAENIAYGRPGASRDAIEAAAVAARADEFIRRLPRGYDEVIGERGVTLSGGERQRIAIARALLKDAPIVVLDEPTSALDARTEKLLLEAFGTLMRGRTTLIIAHRLSTLRNVDRVVVLDQGRVAEEGAPQQLLAGNGLFRHFHRLQFGSATTA